MLEYMFVTLYNVKKTKILLTIVLLQLGGIL